MLSIWPPMGGTLAAGMALVGGAPASVAGATGGGGGGNGGEGGGATLVGIGGCGGAQLVGDGGIGEPASMDGPSGWHSLWFAGRTAAVAGSLTGILAHWPSPALFAGDTEAVRGCGGVMAPAL